MTRIRRSNNLRLTWQVSPKNKITVFANPQWQCWCHFGISSGTSSPEAVPIHEVMPKLRRPGQMERADYQQAPVGGRRVL